MALIFTSFAIHSVYHEKHIIEWWSLIKCHVCMYVNAYSSKCIHSFKFHYSTESSCIHTRGKLVHLLFRYFCSSISPCCLAWEKAVFPCKYNIITKHNSQVWIFRMGVTRAVPVIQISNWAILYGWHVMAIHKRREVNLQFHCKEVNLQFHCKGVSLTQSSNVWMSCSL